MCCFNFIVGESEMFGTRTQQRCGDGIPIKQYPDPIPNLARYAQPKFDLTRLKSIKS